MTGRVVSRPAIWLALLLWAMLLPLAGASARAAGPAPQDRRCFASGTRAETLASLAAAPARWDCGRPDYTLSGERAFLRFALDPAQPQPHYLVAVRGALVAVRVLVIDADGATRERTYRSDQLTPAYINGFFKVALPAIGPQSRTVVVAFDLPTSRMTLGQARLAVDDPGDTPAGHRLLILLAALCGMLVMPLMFNAAFYRILRERFVLWHSALVISLLLTILAKSGLSRELVDLPVMALSGLTTLIFGLSVASGIMFAHTFIEPGKLRPGIRRALPWAARWALFTSAFHAGFPFVLRAVQSDLYYFAYLPVLALLLWTLADALARGSRAAKFQLAGWAPLLSVGAIRIVTGLVPTLTATDAMPLFYFGCVFEVLATTLGVADRFMAMKDQRDIARTEARVLERLTERDALTGLFNRRVIEGRFAQLRGEGFTTLALLDLDHFKAVNDAFGHAVGDRVLQAVAAALEPDEDTLVLRMGGEEFLLLLRGGSAIQRAEARRQAITARVARDVEGLDRPQTASMGLVDVPRDAAPVAGFTELYARADQLLYDAKQAGRNRTISEKMTLFSAHRRNRRKTDRRKAAA
ncbi:MAG TPA: diguanylate cyclase [Sphingomonadaceae bacterium]